MRLLVTRPDPDGESTAAALRARGHEVMLAPMLRVEPVADADLGVGPWAGLLLTSANGARAIARHPRFVELAALPVLAVGAASAEAARAEGFAAVESADGDGGDLVRLTAARFSGSPLPLLYPAGEERARDLAGALAAHGIAVSTAAIYRTVQVTAFPSAARDALVAGGIGGVLHFSRRSAETYVAAARGLLPQALAPVHFCLSERSAEPLRAAGAADVRVAARPDEATLIELVAPPR